MKCSFNCGRSNFKFHLHQSSSTATVTSTKTSTETSTTTATSTHFECPPPSIIDDEEEDDAGDGRLTGAKGGELASHDEARRLFELGITADPAHGPLYNAYG